MTSALKARKEQRHAADVPDATFAGSQVAMEELRNELLLRLDDKLRPPGFRLRKTLRDFRRDVGQSTQIFHVTFINHPGDFDVTVDVAVRHHRVEEALNEGRPDLKESEKKLTATVGAGLGNITGSGQHRWTVTSGHDIPLVVDGIVSNVEKVGLPFLERFTSLEETFRVLSLKGSEATLICPLPEKRAKIMQIMEALLRSNATEPLLKPSLSD